MSFSFIAAVGGNASGAGTTLAASSSLNVAASDLLVAICKYEGGDGTFGVEKNTGTPVNAFTFDAEDKIVHAADAVFAMGYLLSASADATMTPELQSPSRTWRQFIVLQFRPDSGDTVTKADSSVADGVSTAPNSGNFDLGTGDDWVVVGGYGDYSGNTTTSEQINGVAATEPTNSPQSNTSAWYRLVTTTFNGAASATLTDIDWLCGGIAFKATASGGAALVHRSLLLGVGT